MIKAIIFDFDGVIHDTFEMAYRINQRISPGISRDEYRDFFNGNIYEHKKVTRELSDLFFKYQKEEIKKLKINTEIRDELLKLKDAYELFIISSNTEESLNNYFENNDLTQVFKRILGKESHTSKIEKFKILFNEYNLTKDNCIFITDTLGEVWKKLFV